jgi:hypothetical protein
MAMRTGGGSGGSATIVGDVEVVQPTHDDLNANVNIQVGDADVSLTNPVPVGGLTTIVVDTPTITAGAYSAKDAVGDRLEFANAVRATPLSGIIQSITVIDDGNQAAELVLTLFDQAFTATGDNAAFDPTDADLQNCIGIVRINTADYQSFADNCVATTPPIGLPIVLAATTLYGQLMCVGAPVYTATDDLTIKVHIIQD